MAKKATPVTEAEANEPNVQEIKTDVPGVGPVSTFFRVEYVDDVSGKPAADIEPVVMLFPVYQEEEITVIGEDGEPEKNEDGTDKLTTRKVIGYERREIDLSAANVTKLMKALQPFYDKSREAAAPVVASAARKRSSAAASDPAKAEAAAWRKRVKTWLEENRPELGVKHNTKGQLGEDKIAVYLANVKDDPRPASA